jgi:hypothetical protein
MGEQKQEELIRLQVPNIISDELCNRAYFSKYTLKIIRKSHGSLGQVHQRGLAGKTKKSFIQNKMLRVFSKQVKPLRLQTSKHFYQV